MDGKWKTLSVCRFSKSGNSRIISISVHKHKSYFHSARWKRCLFLVCLFLLFFFWDSVTLCSPGWPEVFCVDQAVLKRRDPPASPSAEIKSVWHPAQLGYEFFLKKIYFLFPLLKEIFKEVDRDIWEWLLAEVGRGYWIPWSQGDGQLWVFQFGCWELDSSWLQSRLSSPYTDSLMGLARRCY